MLVVCAAAAVAQGLGAEEASAAAFRLRHETARQVRGHGLRQAHARRHVQRPSQQPVRRHVQRQSLHPARQLDLQQGLQQNP